MYFVLVVNVVSKRKTLRALVRKGALLKLCYYLLSFRLRRGWNAKKVDEIGVGVDGERPERREGKERAGKGGGSAVRLAKWQCLRGGRRGPGRDLTLSLRFTSGSPLRGIICGGDRNPIRPGKEDVFTLALHSSHHNESASRRPGPGASAFSCFDNCGGQRRHQTESVKGKGDVLLSNAVTGQTHTTVQQVLA